MAKISIKGPIISNDDQWIYDWLEMDATSPKMVHDQIEAANGEELEVEINSGGGSVFDGSEIYTALKSHPKKVTVDIVGLAASAASFIAMAGDLIRMTPTGQMMIHNSSIRAAGDYHDMNKASEILQNVNQTVANAYKLKTGKSDQELLDMMDRETWLTPQQAKDLGFIDEIMFDTFNTISLVASANVSGMLPAALIDKIRDKFKSSQNAEAAIFARQKVAAQIKLLKLKGVESE